MADDINAAEAYDLPSEEEDQVASSQASGSASPAQPDTSTTSRPALGPTRSQYQIRSAEKFKGVANRIIFSRYYILFYFVMMSLSLTTVVLSLRATRESGAGRRACQPLKYPSTGPQVGQSQWEVILPGWS